MQRMGSNCIGHMHACMRYLDPINLTNTISISELHGFRHMFKLYPISSYKILGIANYTVSGDLITMFVIQINHFKW